jgi:hypothetical protein
MEDQARKVFGSTHSSSTGDFSIVGLPGENVSIVVPDQFGPAARNDRPRYS